MCATVIGDLIGEFPKQRSSRMSDRTSRPAVSGEDGRSAAVMSMTNASTRRLGQTRARWKSERKVGRDATAWLT